MPAIGLRRVVPNRELAEREERKLSQPDPPQEAYTGIAGHIERFWQEAQIAKRPMEDQMLRALRQRTGIYEPSELGLIREQGGSEIFMMLTSAKCRAAEAWLREILTPDTDKPWGLEPSPMPELPPPVAQAIIQAITEQAMAAGWEIDDRRIDEHLLKIKTLAYQRLKELSKEVAERHELRIADQLADGGWDTALSEFIYDLVTYPAAFIKGPILRKRKVLKWIPSSGGEWLPKVENTLQLDYERRSPFDIFPAPAMRNIQYGNLIDRHRFTREQLQELVGVPGYSRQAIYAVIEQFGAKGYSSRTYHDFERAILELRRHEEYDSEGTIECLNFWGSCSGRMLLDWQFRNGLPVGEKIDPNREYQVEAWKIAGYVIKAQINEDPLGKKPYSKTSFEEIPGAFWGYSLPDLGRDCQGMCNGAARAMANNAAIASGPQVVQYIDRLADGETPSKPYPWKLYQMTSDPQGSNRQAVEFYQPNMNIQELMLIYNHFERVFDNISGFPNYTYGDAKVGGAGRTSSGLAQLMGNVGKGVRRVIKSVDLNVIRPIIGRTYNYNMQFDPDPTIKGDLHPVTSGSAALLVKDMAQLRRRELLQATLNPIDMQIIGVEGRAEMLRETIKAADMPVDKILPDKMTLQLRTAGMPQPHEILGNAGPNAEGGTPDGVAGAGGTPAGATQTDNAGQPPNGTAIRKATQGFRDGGVVRRRALELDNDL